MHLEGSSQVPVPGTVGWLPEALNQPAFGELKQILAFFLEFLLHLPVANCKHLKFPSAIRFLFAPRYHRGHHTAWLVLHLTGLWSAFCRGHLGYLYPDPVGYPGMLSSCPSTFTLSGFAWGAGVGLQPLQALSWSSAQQD